MWPPGSNGASKAICGFARILTSIPTEVTHVHTQTQHGGRFMQPQAQARKTEPISHPTYKTLKRVSMQEQSQLKNLRKQQL